jgi:hypothetical protein
VPARGSFSLHTKREVVWGYDNYVIIIVAKRGATEPSQLTLSGNLPVTTFL